MIVKEPMKLAYDVLREAGRYGDNAGITAMDLEKKCNARYGKRCNDYWTKQLEALADMGYAEKARALSGKAAIWIAADPWGDA